MQHGTTDPESGWFRQGEHKHVFAYAVETACDRNVWILGHTVHPGNEHDSRTFKPLYDKIKGYAPEIVIMDAGYRTPAIAHELHTDGVQTLLPYKRPMTRDGFFKKYEYVYDEYYDCYICPEDYILTYRTTDRAWYRVYKSCGTHCAHCPSLERCTHSRSHVKTVTRHVWEGHMETVEGKARMEMKAGLTFVCMNLKKLAGILARKGRGDCRPKNVHLILKKIYAKMKERYWSLAPAPLFVYSPFCMLFISYRK